MSGTGGRVSSAPVFTVGSPRSGTTLLYHMLLSAGGFVRFRTETHVFNTLGPRFHGLRTPKDREGALAVWLGSDCHTLSGLSDAEVRAAVEQSVRCAGDFLRVIMELMARRQGVARWAETTPAHALHVEQIAREIPNALFLHVVRDGRDVAASLAKQGWIRPFPFDRHHLTLPAGAYWAWVVKSCRRQGERIGSRYLEVHYEDLIDSPAVTLARIAGFIHHDLDLERIQRVGVGSVSKPNTSFADARSSFKGRWRSELDAAEGNALDGMLRRPLGSFGYRSAAAPSIGAAARLGLYRAVFASRDWIKRNTFLGRHITNLSFFAQGSMPITPEKMSGLDGPTAA